MVHAFFVHSENHFWGIRIWWVLDQSSRGDPWLWVQKFGEHQPKVWNFHWLGNFLSFLMNSDEISAINYHFIYYYILSIFFFIYFYLFLYYHFIYSVYKYFITISNSTLNSKAVHPMSYKEFFIPGAIVVVLRVLYRIMFKGTNSLRSNCQVNTLA